MRELYPFLSGGLSISLYYPVRVITGIPYTGKVVAAFFSRNSDEKKRLRFLERLIDVPEHSP